MPCSIWMPPWASGPVFTVSRPMRTGLPCARADRGSAAARAVPTRNFRRSRVSAIACSFRERREWGGSPLVCTRCSGPAARAHLAGSADLEGRGLVRHPPSHRHVPQLLPQRSTSASTTSSGRSMSMGFAVGTQHGRPVTQNTSVRLPSGSKK